LIVASGANPAQVNSTVGRNPLAIFVNIRSLSVWQGRQIMQHSLKAGIQHYLPIGLAVCALVLCACSPVSTGGVGTVVPQHASTRIGQRGDTTWDLVALGDSTPTGHGVGVDNSYVQLYAEYIEEDFGVGVVVHNWATDSTRTVAEWAEEVRNNDELRGDLRNAEVITIWLGWHDVIPHIGVPRGGPCYPRSREVDWDCLAEVTAPMEGAFKDRLSEIVSLASSSEALILIADVGIPPLFVASWKEDGTFDDLRQHAYKVWRAYIVQAASRHGVYVVNTYEVLNGVNGDQEMSPDYVQSDGLHLNAQGHRLLADRHRRVGYEYLR
jgi:lysophospholipase L1-like esterase